MSPSCRDKLSCAGPATCSWSCLLATAERRADRPASGRRVMEGEVAVVEVMVIVREGEEVRRGDMERRAGDPRSKDSRISPELSWSASEEDSPSGRMACQEQ